MEPWGDYRCTSCGADVPSVHEPPVTVDNDTLCTECAGKKIAALRARLDKVEGALINLKNILPIRYHRLVNGVLEAGWPTGATAPEEKP